MVHTKRTLFLSFVLIVALLLDPARSFTHTVILDDLYWNLLQYYTFKRRGISGRGIPNYPLGELYYLH